MIGVKMISPEVKGLGKKFLQELRPAAQTRVDLLLVQFKQEMEADMRRPKSGRLYRRKNGTTHRASAPGESPAIDTAKFVNSLYIVGPKWKAWRVEGHVASRLKKAEWLEYGTSRMKPRPVWRIVMRRMQRRVAARGHKFKMIP